MLPFYSSLVIVFPDFVLSSRWLFFAADAVVLNFAFTFQVANLFITGNFLEQEALTHYFFVYLPNINQAF